MRDGTCFWDDLGVDESLVYFARELHNKFIKNCEQLSQ